MDFLLFLSYQTKLNMKKLLLGLMTAGGVINCTAQWSVIPIPSSGKMESLEFITTSRGFACGVTTFFKTVDGGLTWSTSPVMGFRDIDFVDSLVGYAAGNVGLIQKTTDGGKTWTSKTAPNSSSLWAVSAVSNKDAFFGVTGGFVYKTTNSGFSFTKQTSAGTGVTLQDLHFTSTANGCAAGSDGSIYRTTNGGADWENVYTTPVPAGLNAIYNVNTSLAFAVGTKGIIAISINSGLHWYPRTSGTTQTLHSVHFSDALNGMIVGDSGIVLRTTDGGGSWFLENAGTTANLYSVFMTSATSAVIGGTSNVYKNTNLYIPPSSTSVLEESQPGFGFSVYPNPTQEFLFINRKNAQVSDNSYVIIDRIGKQVAQGTLHLNEHGIDVSFLSQGIYYIQLSDDLNGSVVKTFTRN